MTQLGYISAPNEEWQDLVSWDEELDIPGFGGDTNFSGSHSYHVPDSVTSEQPYLVSAPPSIVDGPSSLQYIVSAPPSVLDGSASSGQFYCTSPSFDTATSPLAGQDDGHYFGSFGACDNDLSPLSRIPESLILDTRYERIADSFGGSTDSYGSTPETVFNPFVVGSSHSFSGMDVRVSQVFSTVGTWADQPQIIEPIVESDENSGEAVPIPIPQPLLQSFSTVPVYSQLGGSSLQHNRSRAITIPEVTRGSASHSYGSSSGQWSRGVPPILSVSPISHRRPRSVALSRSTSQSRRKLGTPSPTLDSYGWVSYHPNPLTNRLAPTSSEGLQGRTPRGRKKGLTAEQRLHAAQMRVIGACSNCQRRKEKCDRGTPCKSCLEHYKGDLVNHPCRDTVLSDLSSTFLSDRLGWHPTTRSLESFVSPSSFNVATGITYKIPLNFGFGPALPVPVHALQIEDTHALVHKHIIYSWPPESSSGSAHTHAVLPAVLTQDATNNLMQTLDSHLSLLVTHHFRAFPLYCSPLRILREVYIFSRSIPTSTANYHILHEALKLLVLVHIGGDITLPTRAESPALAKLIRNTMDLDPSLNPTPCFIRSQFSAVMPALALRLMKDVLASLEQLLLNRACDEWPIALAVLMTILMTVESVHYHAAKLPYHHMYDAVSARRACTADDDRTLDDEGVKTLLAFYTACFAGCHTRLRPDWEGEAAPVRNARGGVAVSPEDAFVESVRDAVRRASGEGYLVGKAGEGRRGEDMGWFFDRLVARVLILRV